MIKFEGFQSTLFEFLEQLADNNNRPWFQENKTRYEHDALEPAMAFIRAFQPRLKRISPSFVASDRRVGGSLMRVYRDTRFAKGGEPYNVCKTASICSWSSHNRHTSAGPKSGERREVPKSSMARQCGASSRTA
jgi:uncharacterized protein (TIGR02453 family)